MQGTATVERGRQDKKETNKQERVDFIIRVAFAPREELPGWVAKKWPAQIEDSTNNEGVRFSDELRSFLMNPKGNFVRKFENIEDARSYAFFLYSVLQYSGIYKPEVEDRPKLSGVDIEIDRDNLEVTLKVRERKHIAPLGDMEREAMAAQADVSPREEKPREFKMPPVQKKEVPARAKSHEVSSDPLAGIDVDGRTRIAKSEEQMRSILSRKFTDSDREVLPIIPKRDTIDQIIGAIQDSEKLYSFEITGQTRRREVEIALNKCGAKYRIEELGPRKFRVIINSEDIAQADL